MQWQYTKWDDSFKVLKELSSLFSLFNYLLLQANGDIHEVVQWMKILQQKGFLNPELDFNKFLSQLEEDDLIHSSEDGYELTPKGERRIRQDALMQIFGNLKKSAFGQHHVPIPGEGGENLTETRPYQFGDSITHIDPHATLNNAIRNSGPDNIAIHEEDIEVYEKEHTSACATVLLIDISHSMVLYGEDRITPAKQVALALTELILTRFPKDKLHIVTFGDEAREITIKDLPYLKVGPFHTNTKAGLHLA